MGAADEEVGQAQEEREEGEGGGVGGGGGAGRDGKGEKEAFAGGGFVESVWGRGALVSGRVEGRSRWRGAWRGAYFSGLSSGWSVIIKCSKASPACSMALISSGVRRASVISALSLMTVAQDGSRGWSLVLVREMS